MDNIKYNQIRYNRKRQWYRLTLGMGQLINYPIINTLWLLLGAGIWGLVKLKQLFEMGVDVPELLAPIFNGSIMFFIIVVPIFIAVGIIQGLGEITARKDEANVFRAFSDRRDVKNEAPILIYKKKLKGKNVIVREFYTTIPMERWQQKKEAISDIMNIHFVADLEYGGEYNGNRIVMKSAKGRANAKKEVLYDDIF
ncbi:hypothetical protein [Cellulosilyticum sp. I15G10I2]|uniref:hypothetical protein n=1 Tax=Cellulosilyticum sp. I15G10I2 TaxID=1892843 RepID=UPI00085CC0A3|nr:hypothetical protein [Cellulosilyticum sp. I15G10I2]